MSAAHDITLDLIHEARRQECVDIAKRMQSDLARVIDELEAGEMCHAECALYTMRREDEQLEATLKLMLKGGG